VFVPVGDELGTVCIRSVAAFRPYPTNAITNDPVSNRDEHPMPQSLVQVLIHVVFSTKNRADLIVPGILFVHSWLHCIDRRCHECTNKTVWKPTNSLFAKRSRVSVWLFRHLRSFAINPTVDWPRCTQIKTPPKN